MGLYTLFLSPYATTFPESVSDPAYSQLATALNYQGRYNVNIYQAAQVLLVNNGDSSAISFPSTVSMSDWRFVILRVNGNASINSVGTDDVGGPISGYTAAYGTSLYKGYVILSTYNVTSFTLSALAANTTIDVFIAVSAED
jgi:hypothetical protein